MLSAVTDLGSPQSGSLIDQIVHEGDRRMPAAALEAEVNQYRAELAAETDEDGRRLAVRNCHHRPRTLVNAAGPGRRSPRRRPPRAVTGAHLVAIVRSGARFEDGVLVERLEAVA
ncbi:hypothetical protein [Streptomyces sp. NPDC007172]|uniref:hypothetical protein n=1 Tax=Streptomyces sp. NPDC007172 TaxID=3364776 RepID=UPI0036C9B1C6